MEDKVVKARIDAKAGAVTLEGEPGLDFPITFTVSELDTLRWEFKGIPTGYRARIRFVGFPPGPEPTFFQHGNTLQAEAGVIIGGFIDGHAPNGTYSYLVELVSPHGDVTRLSDGAKGTPAGMVGGVKEKGSGSGGVEEGGPGP